MRPTPRLALFVVVLLAAACAPRLHGDVWSDDSYDFTNRRSFAISDYKRPPAGSERDARRRLAERLIAAELERRGFRQADDPASADLAVDVLLGQTYRARTSGSSTWGKLAGIEVSILDRRTGRSVWRGWVAESWYDSANPDEEIPKAVEFLATELAKPRE